MKTASITCLVRNGLLSLREFAAAENKFSSEIILEPPGSKTPKGEKITIQPVGDLAGNINSHNKETDKTEYLKMKIQLCKQKWPLKTPK